MTTKILWRHPKLPIVLERYSLDTANLPIVDAKKELEHHIKTKADKNAKTWGYFPELKPAKREYPSTLRLTVSFTNNVIEKSSSLNKLKLNLAFVRLATAEPKSDFGGLHIDVSAGIDHASPKNRDPKSEVLRLLFNLGKYPRTIEFSELDVDELQKQGIAVKRYKYEILKLTSVKMFKLSIPPLEKGILYGVRFISSKIPHAGRTTQQGHFLISYGSYASRKVAKRVFEK